MLKNKLALTALAVSLMGGIALADHERGRGGERERGGERGRVVERHERDRVVVAPRNEYRGDRHVYINRDNNRFNFRGGEYRTYHRPVIRERYYDYRYRPRMIVESYDAMPGYVWIQGGWQWNGAEWQWFGGHYVVEGGY